MFYPIASDSWNALPTPVTGFITRNMNRILIIVEEALTVLSCVCPAAFRWVVTKYMWNEIETVEIIGNKKITAYLNFHGHFPKFEFNEAITPVLFCHGDHSHPLTLLHLADLAKPKGRVVFSLYLPHCHEDEDGCAQSDLLLDYAIHKIKKFVKNRGGKFNGILGIGHSKGAILLANRQFVHHDLRIKATCSIAGRLSVCEETKGLPQEFEMFIKRIAKNIKNYPQEKLMQIIPENDWNASYASMAVRPEKKLLCCRWDAFKRPLLNRHIQMC